MMTINYYDFLWFQLLLVNSIEKLWVAKDPKILRFQKNNVSAKSLSSISREEYLCNVRNYKKFRIINKSCKSFIESVTSVRKC